MSKIKKAKATTLWGCRFDGTINLKECLCGIGQCDRISYLKESTKSFER